jgi:SAM-dependent methyltransferase
VHDSSLEEIQHIYQQHPLREDRILARIMTQRGSLVDITELDLAQDPLTEITDQNHVGGTQFVEQLARMSGIGRHSRVLDLGCGLGGSVRYLAYRYGCRGLGIDISRERMIQAESLTRLAGLQHLVNFQFGDMTAIHLPPDQFDVLWGQGSWGHLSDKQAFLERWTPYLKDGGRVAMEDACRRLPPPGEPHDRLLRELEESWKAHLVTAGTWLDLLERQRYSVEVSEDLSEELHSYYVRLIEIDGEPGAPCVPERERTGWHNAVALTQSGVLGYCRIVARKLG